LLNWSAALMRSSVSRHSVLTGALFALKAAAAALCFCSAAAAQEPALEVGRFSLLQPGQDFPPAWKPLEFRNIGRHTAYTLVREQGSTVVKAVAEASASGLMREIEVDPREYPLIQWRWRIDNVLAAGNPARRDGDDYPARIYITFKYEPERLSPLERAMYTLARAFSGRDLPYAAISYIWESKLPRGTLLTSAYTERLRMFVVQSGAENLGRWQSEERNVYEDYRKAFNEEPPSISGIAIMTDTDDTGERAVAYYGDIAFKRAYP
jgi:hypothetical protein